MSEPKSLTVADPVSQEERDYISKLDVAKAGIAEKNLMLDLEKIGLVAAARRVDSQYSEVFNKILVDRGLPPETLIQVDMSTGGIRVIRDGAPAPAEEAPPAEAV